MKLLILTDGSTAMVDDEDFARRRQILKETLESFQVPEEIQTVLLTHTDQLRPQITPESGSDCDPMAARERVNKR